MHEEREIKVRIEQRPKNDGIWKFLLFMEAFAFLPSKSFQRKEQSVSIFVLLSASSALSKIFPSIW